MKRNYFLIFILLGATVAHAQKPVAKFSASDSTLCAFDCINFTDSSTNNPTQWLWTFYGANPLTSTVQNPATVCYLNSGRFGVRLVVSNSYGSDTLTVDSLINVNMAPPVPVITQSTGLSDTLRVSTDTSYVSYQWYYNSTLIPGATDSVLVITQSGNYNVSVKDAFGCTIAVGINVVFPLPPEWVWIHGDSLPGSPGHYGIQGVPDPADNPRSLFEPCEWTDTSGHFWLFGGTDSNGIAFSDLWRYDPAENEWTWIKGPAQPNDAGHYGTRGIPSPMNNPPARAYGVATWTDLENNLWLFGGASPYGAASYNDLWKYTIATDMWTWIKGADTTGDPGNYGIMGVPDTSNVPPNRGGTSASWVDSNGDLWLFGGEEYLSGSPVYNDMWRYRISTNTWTWMKGSNLINQHGIYGTKGVESAANVPGGRSVSSHWKDKYGNFLLFGGNDGSNGYFTDMWSYNPFTNNWKWISGSNDTAFAGIFGDQCNLTTTNLPYNRYENRACWTDAKGDFWMFGGGIGHIVFFDVTRNDLWKYCTVSNEWVNVTGDSTGIAPGFWGTKGVASPLNTPNGRAGSVGWKDKNGNLYLFGGMSSYSSNGYNDLWMFTNSASCAVCPDSTTAIKSMENLPGSDYILYPDPVRNTLYIKGEVIGKTWVKFYNVLGEEILTRQSDQSIDRQNFEFPVDVSYLSQGIYFLQIICGMNTYEKRFIKQ